jgi:hypothetical protein
MVKLTGPGNKCYLAASQNKSALKIFNINAPGRVYALQPIDESAVFTLANGKKYKTEFYYGSSFLSQGQRVVLAPANVQSIEITNSKGIKRKL